MCWESRFLLLGKMFLKYVGSPFLTPGSPAGCMLDWASKTISGDIHPHHLVVGAGGGVAGRMETVRPRSFLYLGFCLVCPLLQVPVNLPLSRELDPGDLQAPVYLGTKAY